MINLEMTVQETEKSAKEHRILCKMGVYGSYILLATGAGALINSGITESYDSLVYEGSVAFLGASGRVMWGYASKSVEKLEREVENAREVIKNYAF